MFSLYEKYKMKLLEPAWIHIECPIAHTYTTTFYNTNFASECILQDRDMA